MVVSCGAGLAKRDPVHLSSKMCVDGANETGLSTLSAVVALCLLACVVIVHPIVLSLQVSIESRGVQQYRFAPPRPLALSVC